MAVSDRWHRAPEPGDQPCRCGRGRNRLYPSVDHESGDRWKVRWRDPATGKQKSRNFEVRDGKDPNRCADAFDKLIQGQLATRTYADPRAGEVTLHSYAETWRASRTHGKSTAGIVESRLRNHVYEGAPGTGRTPKGGVSIGHHPMALLASRPTLCAAWIAAMPLAEGARRMVVIAVSAVFDAAVEDGVVPRNPLRSSSVSRPGRGDGEVQPFTAAEVDAIAAGMDQRYRLMPRLAAGTGMRQMEMSGLGADDIHAAGRRPRVRAARQLLAVGGVLHFAPLKGRKPPRDIPLALPVARELERHCGAFPPVPVTLPWYEPGSKMHGELVTVRLVLTRPDGTPLTRGSSDSAWATGVRRMLAGTVPGARRKGRRVRGWNIHRGRHTAASAWLRAGIDIVRVAAWLGDTVAVVSTTYAHLMPGDDDGETHGREAVGAFFGGGASVPDVSGTGTG
jgi:integrase